MAGCPVAQCQRAHPLSEMATDRKREGVYGVNLCNGCLLLYLNNLFTLSFTETSFSMKDPRQGAAAIVFLVFYVLAFAFTLYCLFTRRGKRYIFSAFLFNLLRIGANISSLGWAIHLYENFDWLVASLILGTEGEQLTLTGRELMSRLLRTRTGNSVRILPHHLPLLMIGSSSSGMRKRLSVLRCFTPTYLKDATSVFTVSPMLPFGSSGVSKKSGC